MEDIINALPDAAQQVSNIITLLFTSGLGLVVVPFLLVSLIGLVFSVARGGKSD